MALMVSTPYRCTVPLLTQFTPGQSLTAIISIEAPGPLKRGVANTTDRDFQVRFTIDRAVVTVVDVKPLQGGWNPGHEEFGWTPTRREPTWGQYVINQRIGYLGAGGIAPPFDVQPGGLYEVTLKAVSKGTCAFDLNACKIGAFDTGAALIDGIISVV